MFTDKCNNGFELKTKNIPNLESFLNPISYKKVY